MIKAKIVVKLNKLPDLTGKLRTEVAEIVQSAAEQCAELARGRAPVDTGDLAGSITVVQESDLTQRVEIGEFYAHFLEFGTRKMAAKPFVTPAVEMVKPTFSQEARSVVERVAR